MNHQWPEWKDVAEGSEDSVYSIRQVLSFLRGAYKDRDYNKAEKLLKLREERIKDQVVEEVKPLMVEMEKKIEVEERLRMEVEKGLELKIEVVERLRKECEELREENLRLKSGEKMKGKVADVGKDDKERVKDLEMKLEIEVQSSKRTEKELEVWIRKFYELEAKVLSLTKDYDLFRSLEADAQGSEMEAEVQAIVRSSRNQIAEGANSVNPVSAAEHGLGNCIEISSSSEDDPREVQLGSKDKSDLAPVKLDYESDHGSPEVSSGLKRKHMSSIHEDKTESIQQPSTGEGTLPKLPIQDENVQPSSESLTPAPGFDILKSVNPGQAEGTSRGSKFSLDDEHYKKSLLEKLKPHWDDISSDSSSDL